MCSVVQSMGDIFKAFLVLYICTNSTLTDIPMLYYDIIYTFLLMPDVGTIFMMFENFSDLYCMRIMSFGYIYETMCECVCVVSQLVLLVAGFVTLIPTDLIFGQISRTARCIPAGLLMM